MCTFIEKGLDWINLKTVIYSQLVTLKVRLNEKLVGLTKLGKIWRRISLQFLLRISLLIMLQRYALYTQHIMFVILYLWTYSDDRGPQIFSSRAAYCSALTWIIRIVGIVLDIWVGIASTLRNRGNGIRFLREASDFFPSVKSTDRSWARWVRLSSRVSLTSFLKRIAGGTWIGPPPLFSAKLTSARRCGSAVLLFFTALCLVKYNEGSSLHHTVWCNLVHTLTIYRLTCWYNWLTLLNDGFGGLVVSMLASGT